MLSDILRENDGRNIESEIVKYREGKCVFQFFDKEKFLIERKLEM